VGVHTPKFAFEHVGSNVQAQAPALGVHYPVALDDNRATWPLTQGRPPVLPARRTQLDPATAVALARSFRRAPWSARFG
jgi:hypothetical protein